MSNLRYHRKLAKLTQDQLAKQVSMYQSDISALEHGRRVMFAGQRKRLASALGVAPEAL